MLGKKVNLYQRSKKKEEVRSSFQDIDTSAIGDLAFLLLIFFIVTSSFLLRQGIIFSLPAPNSSAERVDAKRLLEITPRASDYTFQGQNFDQVDLKRALRRAAASISKPIVIIKMNSEVAYSQFIGALSIAKELKLSKVSLKRIN